MDCLLKSTFVPNHLRRRPARAPFVKPTLPLHAFAFFASTPLRALRFPLALPLLIPCAAARQDAAPPEAGRKLLHGRWGASGGATSGRAGVDGTRRDTPPFFGGPWMGCPWLAEDRRQGPRRGEYCGGPSRQVQLHTGNKRVKPFAASVLAVLILALLALSASAAVSPLQIGILGDKCQLVSPETSVIGLRIGLASDNATVAGLDLGWGSLARHFSGIRLNVLSSADECNGISIALLADVSEHVNGIAIAFLEPLVFERPGEPALFQHVNGATIAFAGFAEEINGLQLACFAQATTIRGIQAAAMPLARTACGLQFGLFNRADDLYGLQVGLVNHAESLRGVQIGLLNFDTSSSWSCLPLLRVSL